MHLSSVSRFFWVLLALLASEILGKTNDQTLTPYNIEIFEKNARYHLIASLDPEDRKQLNGFQLFDHNNRLIQFIPHEQDLSNKVPEYILGKIPSALPVNCVDCNFDGYPDLMLREDISPRYQSFEIWTWDTALKKFVLNKPLNDAEINRADLKTGHLFSGGSGGHGHFSTNAYCYDKSGKLIHLYTNLIDYGENKESRIYYKNGEAIKTVVSIPEPLK